VKDIHDRKNLHPILRPFTFVFPLWNQQVTGEGLQAGKPMSRQGDGADEIQTLLALSLPVAS
jgi:hypothetical protein